MLDLLHAAEKDLPRLLLDKEGWTSLRLDYHPPFVDRLKRAWNGYRIFLHRIHPCAADEPVFHPHPWPSAMRVLSGVYEIAVGHGAGETPPPIAARLVVSGAMEYEMTDVDGWHYVRPVGGVAMTVMVSGRPWDRPAPETHRPPEPLAPEVIEEMLGWYRRVYP